MQVHLNDSFNIYRLLNLKGVGPAKVRAIYRAAENADLCLESLFEDGSTISNLLKSEQIEQLEVVRDACRDNFSRLEDEEVKVLSCFDDNYPVRLKAKLGEKAPLLLTVKGNGTLLNKTGVGFCGSRKASHKGIATTEDCTEQLSMAGCNINSGYASGVDMTAHRVALESGGSTTVVLPEGMFHFRVKKQLEDVWDWSRICVVSEFLPGLPWSARNAMQRNTTICALSHLMVLIEAGATGGSIAAGKTSLELDIPLLAPVYEGMPETAIGNRLLLEQGAKRFFKSKSTGRANLQYIVDYLKHQSEIKYDTAVQNSHMVCESDQLDLYANNKNNNI